MVIISQTLRFPYPLPRFLHLHLQERWDCYVAQNAEMLTCKHDITAMTQETQVSLDQDLADRRLQARVGSLLGSVDDIEPGLAVMPVSNQADRLAVLAVHEHNDHLAVAWLGAVQRTGTGQVGRASRLEVKGADDPQPGLC